MVVSLLVCELVNIHGSMFEASFRDLKFLHHEWLSCKIKVFWSSFHLSCLLYLTRIEAWKAGPGLWQDSWSILKVFLPARYSLGHIRLSRIFFKVFFFESWYIFNCDCVNLDVWSVLLVVVVDTKFHLWPSIVTRNSIQRFLSKPVSSYQPL